MATPNNTNWLVRIDSDDAMNYLYANYESSVSCENGGIDVKFDKRLKPYKPDAAKQAASCAHTPASSPIVDKPAAAAPAPDDSAKPSKSDAKLDTKPTPALQPRITYIHGPCGGAVCHMRPCRCPKSFIVGGPWETAAAAQRAGYPLSKATPEAIACLTHVHKFKHRTDGKPPLSPC